MFIDIILLLIGFVVLIYGAQWLVEGAASLARKHNISELTIGLTIVAFGTSMPEFVVNTFAAYEGHADIAFGNVIGSNIINLFMILGIAGVIAPLVVQSSTVKKEIPISLLAALLLFLLANSIFTEDAVLSRLDGIILLVFFALFLAYVYTQMKSEPEPVDIPHKSLPGWRLWTYILAGLGLLVAGGRLVVVNATNIAEDFGVSEKIIALTIVAGGTSLPELATSVVAAIRKNNNIAVGNIIGSNIFNIFLILGVSSLIRPMHYNLNFNRDIYLLGFGTLLLIAAMFTGKKKSLDRIEAAILLIIYIAYTTYLIINE